MFARSKPGLARSVVEFEYTQPIAGTRVATIYAGFASAATVLALLLFVAGLVGAFAWHPGLFFVLVAIPGWYLVTLVLGRVVIEGVLSAARLSRSRASS